MPRLLIASNRLPVTVEPAGEEFKLSVSAGGLATGLRGICGQREALWIGWPGELSRLETRRQRQLDQELAQRHLAAVYLDRREVRGYYEDIANGVLWPVFHDRIDQLSPDVSGWDEFVHVNEKFASAIAEQHREGDLIWVQDFHLCLVPQMLRKGLPRATIGFFLHIPFPSLDIFSVLPWREQILDGLLGADLIGVHTDAYRDNFAAALQRLLAADLDGQRVRHGDRDTILGVFPMGIDAAAWNARSEDPDVLRDVEELRRGAGGRSLLLGIDRLDYTKGILHRCLAVDKLFSMEEHLGEQLRFIQVTVPSRQGVEAYASLGRSVDETVGRINAAHASASAVPIHRIHRSLSEQELSVFYRAADVMLVTPLRDGMNLVAKEFIASRSDEDGVLVLSEFAGAAAEMPDALHINPYDIEGMASVILRGLTMPREERRDRMRLLRARVFEHNVHHWLRSFVEQLSEAASGTRPSAATPQLKQIAERMQNSQRLVLFLDYDGTLVPFADKPEDAAPDPELLGLLRDLVARPNIQVHLVSGRTKKSIEGWFGGLPIGLHAEHGLWSRPPGKDWQMAQDVPSDWKTVVRPILDHVTGETPGTFIEEKTAGLAWHYRQAADNQTGKSGLGDAQARELALLLTDLLANAPVEVISGNKVIEIRPQGVDKGSIVPDSLDSSKPGLVVAIGDDHSDEDLFGALPKGSVTVRVGEGDTSARYRVRNFADVRALLSALRN